MYYYAQETFLKIPDNDNNTIKISLFLLKKA